MRRYIAFFLTLFALLYCVASATDTVLPQDVTESIPITIADDTRKDDVLNSVEILRKSAADVAEMEPELLDPEQSIDFMDGTEDYPVENKETTSNEDYLDILKSYRDEAEDLTRSMHSRSEEDTPNFMQSNDAVTLDYDFVFGGGRAYLYDEITEECIPLFTDGDGTPSNPFIISTAEDLFQLAYIVNDFKEPMLGAYFYQTEDIDLNTSSRNPWTPIGVGTKTDIYSFFAGVYEGNHHTISGIYVKGGANDLSGLFGATLKATLYDLNIADSTISGGFNCAPLVAYAASTDIIGCTVSNDVTVSSSTYRATLGGVVAVHMPFEDYNSLLSYCASDATVYAKNANSLLGGIVGDIWSYSSSDTQSLIGCYFGGKLSGAYFAGGITGLSEDTDILSCYNTGSIYASEIAAGIVSYAGNILIYSCYNTGNISNAQYSAGIAGYTQYGSIECCYNVGSINGKKSKYDIVCMYDDYTSVFWCYWTYAKDPDAIKISKADLKKQSKLIGFNFSTIWGYKSGKNSGYPILKIFYPEIISCTSSYNENCPSDVILNLRSNYNPVLSIYGVPSGWWSSTTNDTITKVIIDGEFFANYVPSGTYTYKANFGAGCSVPFTITVKNCIHEYGYTDVKKATCTEDGYYRVYCTACSKLLYETDYTKLEHNYEKEYKVDCEPSCTENGIRSRHCSRCSSTIDGEMILALGHDYAIAEQKDPTCSEVGWEAYIYCARCDYSTRQDIPTLPHNLQHHEGKEMTWQEPGWEPYVTCIDCDYTTYCEVLPIHPESVSVTASKNTVSIGEQIQCTATVYPANTTHKDVKWVTSDESVLVVDENGLVTAIASGTAKIQAITEDGNKKGEFELSVQRAITDIEINGDTTVAKGKSVTLKANTYCCERGEKVSFKGTVLWKSSDESIATVSSRGKVTGKTTGTVTITAYAADSPALASVEIYVAAPITSMKFKSSKTTVYVGSAFNLGETLTISPLDNTDSLEWSSSKPGICIVDEKGIVTPIATGTAKITAKAVAGNKTATCTVSVCKEPEGIIITGDVAVAKGKSITLKGVAYYEENGKFIKTKDKISWSSSDESIATVSSKGKVTGKKSGNVTIRAYIEGTDVEGFAKISVAAPITSMKFKSSKTTVYVGSAFNLGETLTISPFDNTDSIEWSSSKPGICTVDKNGIVTPVATGTAKITAKAVAGNKTATCTVSVCKEPEGIIITGDAVVAKGKSITLKGVAYYEENGKFIKTKDKISWSSSDESIATVSSKGKVTGKKSGNVTIRAYIEGTDIEGLAKISVVTPAKTVKLAMTKMNAQVGDVIDLTEYLTVTPQENTDIFAWTSSKTSVATVDKNGVVTVKDVGKTKITVKAQGGNKSASITITVK